MLFRQKMTVIHQSYGTPRVVYALKSCLERNNIYSELKVESKKGLVAYQLLVPRQKAQKARNLLHLYKKELEKA
ncbi:hypothetical protein [Melghirimyces algeriensis]|uniref:Signal transducing protein n=1 Tax=Melghirimyces algeriensis TaxID=910412 RepID=A0A521DY16_9BACL|nr:hypothetical protein [Melghirimyces algeriensis]SMO76512.1 hypothetical protein SAMN06264849_10760 [Melghirimyces algeriensis]